MQLTLIHGVHRSGTSLLTQGLRALGAEAGEFADTYDRDNPQGYAELPAVRHFNDRLFAHLGASWDNWGFRAGLVDWDATDLAPWRKEAAALLQAAFVGPGPFVLKDPRCATLTPFWDRVVPEAGFALRRILILRDPAEVAESQRQRVLRRPSEFPVIAEAEPMAALWAVTMHEFLQAVSDDQTLVVGHARLLAAPGETLAIAATFAGLVPDPAEVARFAAAGVKPELYRSRPVASHAGGREGVWMQAARALFADLTRAGTPRALPMAEARSIAGAQTRLAALMPGLSAVQSTIARMQAVEAERRARYDGLNLLIWSLAPFAAHASADALDSAIDRGLAQAESFDLARGNFAFAHTLGRLFLFARRRADGLAWLERIRPQFGHLEPFAQLEQQLSELPGDQA
ncbi:MAG: hypothetical protein B7Z31_05580 [Rhodobacterales bacterium 12-65-15]|nr:MAG: hypothetical protein B7Z31_05580 [Rhodobacterales bacterium 12-65-15]